jgi:hypothetical protein
MCGFDMRGIACQCVRGGASGGPNCGKTSAGRMMDGKSQRWTVVAFSESPTEVRHKQREYLPAISTPMRQTNEKVTYRFRPR